MIIQARPHGRGLTFSVEPEKRKERCGEDGEGSRLVLSLTLHEPRRVRWMRKTRMIYMWVEAPSPEAVKKLNYDLGTASGPVPVFGMAA